MDTPSLHTLTDAAALRAAFDKRLLALDRLAEEALTKGAQSESVAPWVNGLGRILDEVASLRADLEGCLPCAADGDDAPLRQEQDGQAQEPVQP